MVESKLNRPDKTDIATASLLDKEINMLHNQTVSVKLSLCECDVLGHVSREETFHCFDNVRVAEQVCTTLEVQRAQKDKGEDTI